MFGVTVLVVRRGGKVQCKHRLHVTFIFLYSDGGYGAGGN